MSGTTEGRRKIVVAGGTGMIGRRLCPYLINQGYDVVVLTRDAGRRESKNLRYAQWDPETAGDWQAELNNANAVINLCGEIIAGKRWSDRRKKEILDSRTHPSAALVAAAQSVDCPPKVLLQASGVGYYGTGDATKTEDSAAGNDFLAQLASAWEAPLPALPMRHVAMRFGVVLDTGAGAMPPMLLPFRLFVGGKIASGQQWFSWVHAQDVARAIEFLLNNETIRGPVNIVAPGALQNREVAKTIAEILRRPGFFAAPRFMMTLLLGEQATLLCDGQRVKPARLSAAGCNFKFDSFESALRNLLSR